MDRIIKGQLEFILLMLQTVQHNQLRKDFWEIYNKRCEPIIPSFQYKQDQELNLV